MIRNHSPDGHTSDRKRRRKVLSCYDCRRRKLQCDRATPACSRCVKAGQAENCLYLDEVHDTAGNRSDGHSGALDDTAGRTTADGDAATRLDHQDRRIKQLEAALLEADKKLQLSEPLLRIRPATDKKFPHTPESLVGNGGNALHVAEYGTHINDRETMLLRGRSFKTQFLGSTHPSGLIAHLTDLNSFTKEAFELYPGLKRIRADSKASDKRRDIDLSDTSLDHAHENLQSLLPPKNEADKLLHLYFQNYGLLYNVIHVPSFWNEYQTLWADLTEARTPFVAVVLLAIAAARCLDTQDPPIYTANSSTTRNQALQSITACETWLRNQSQKRVTIEHFQIRFLLLLSKQISARKYKRSWTEAGEFLRFCMSAGLHRNPELVRKSTTALDREMRRRIWTAAVELELQAALDRGMVPQNWPLQSDTTPPGNYHDDQLAADNDTLPPPKPMRELTSSSYMVLAHESLALRHQLTTTLNNIRRNLLFEDVKKWTDEIQVHLDNIPRWSEPNAEIATAKLSLMLRQYVLILHDRQVRQAEIVSEKLFSKMVILETATHIITTHRALLEHDCHALQLSCQDHFRAALSLCHINATVDKPADTTINQVIASRAHVLMDDVIEMLTDMTIRSGREQWQLWTALAAHAWWKAKVDPRRRTHFMAEAVEKIVQPYYRMIACQENRSLLDAPAASDSRAPSNLENGMLDYIATAPALIKTSNGITEQDDSAPLDLDEIAAWTFEDWSFTPADFQEAFGSS